MARIIDKDTRLIDIDFGELTVASSRGEEEFNATSVTSGGPGLGQLLNILPGGTFNGGSFMQYVRLDLDYMARNNEVMLPTEASIQRTSPVPLGSNINGNNFDQIEEFIYIFSRPLNNVELAATTDTLNYNEFRAMGLDGCNERFSSTDIAGKAGWPNQVQTIYAEKRMYSYNNSLGATQSNGELSPTFGPGPSPYNTVFGMPVLDSVTTWGSMGAIVGPNLHCYRVVINRNQTFSDFGFVNKALGGDSLCIWPAVSVRFLCKDPNYSEGEYLTRLANAMNNTAEGAPVA